MFQKHYTLHLSFFRSLFWGSRCFSFSGGMHYSSFFFFCMFNVRLVFISFSLEDSMVPNLSSNFLCLSFFIFCILFTSLPVWMSLCQFALYACNILSLPTCLFVYLSLSVYFSASLSICSSVLSLSLNVTLSTTFPGTRNHHICELITITLAPPSPTLNYIRK